MTDPPLVGCVFWSRHKPIIFNNGRYTTNIPHTVTTTDIKQTGTVYIYTYIYCPYAYPHDAIIKYCAHLYNSSLAALKRDFLASPVAPLPYSIRTNDSPFIKSYLHKVDAELHKSPLCHLCKTHIHNRHNIIRHPHAHHFANPGFVDKPRRGDCTADLMVGDASWLTKREDRTLPLVRAMGVGSQQQHTFE